MATVFGDVSVHVADDFVATVELHRPPNNYFDLILIRSLADAYESLDAGRSCRAIVLCSEGKHFCAGADFLGAGIALDDVLKLEHRQRAHCGSVTVSPSCTPGPSIST